MCGIPHPDVSFGDACLHQPGHNGPHWTPAHGEWTDVSAEAPCFYVGDLVDVLLFGRIWQYGWQVCAGCMPAVVAEHGDAVILWSDRHGRGSWCWVKNLQPAVRPPEEIAADPRARARGAWETWTEEDLRQELAPWKRPRTGD